MSETKVPWYWKNFSFANAVALKGKYVYIRDLADCEPYEKALILVHEAFHVDRQRRIGWFKYLLKYTTKKFRAKEETHAYIRTMEFKHIMGTLKPTAPSIYSQAIAKNYRLEDREWFIYVNLLMAMANIHSDQKNVVADWIDESEVML
jgi:hypothetical protein